LLPLGGYVKMTGESPEQNLQTPGKPVAQQVLEGGGSGPESAGTAEIDPGSFTAHPRWQRMLIGLAGPVANFILAFIIVFIYYHWFNEVPKYLIGSSTVEWVVPGSAADQAGFQPGDVIQRFDNIENPDWMRIGMRTSMNLDQTVQASVLRGGNTVQLLLHVPPESRGEDFDFTVIGILPQGMPGPIGVADVTPGTPAEKAGLRGGDQIELVDGNRFHTVTTLLAYMQTSQSKPIALEVLRNGQKLSLQATPTQVGSGYRLGFTAVGAPMQKGPLPAGRASVRAKNFCLTNSTDIIDVLGRLLTHRGVSITQLSGPIGIARMAGEAAETKEMWPKFYFAAAISLNLGILNLLPFPILDGGLILLLLIEGILRHDISLAVKERIYQAAFVVLVVFFAFIIFNDVTKLLPIFNHVKP
jgi:regulator of sigma E protease